MQLRCRLFRVTRADGRVRLFAADLLETLCRMLGVRPDSSWSARAAESGKARREAPRATVLGWCDLLRLKPRVPFDLQPVLAGDLVALRPLRAGDYPALYAVAADPLIWAQHPESNRHEEAVFRGFFRDALASGGALLALDRADGRIIGSSRFHAYDAARSEVEIGWTFLARSHWGGRYNGEMKRLMLTHAFRYVERVVFLVGRHNVRSQRAVERIGGVRAGTRVGPTGRESLLYEITRAAEYRAAIIP